MKDWSKVLLMLFCCIPPITVIVMGLVGIGLIFFLISEGVKAAREKEWWK